MLKGGFRVWMFLGKIVEPLSRDDVHRWSIRLRQFSFWPTPDFRSLVDFGSLGGPSGTRTRDLLNAIETRSQLRHGPLQIGHR
jgi:hypothetical protein